MSIRTAVAVLLLAAASTVQAQAECPIQQLVIRGTLVDADGAPVAQAAVEARWEERAGELNSLRESDARGGFEVPVAWSTYSGRSFGGTERCEFKLDRIELELRKDGFRTVTERYTIDQLAGPLELQLAAAR